MTKSALVLLAPGAEEMEFVIAVDVMRRCGVSFLICEKCKISKENENNFYAILLI